MTSERSSEIQISTIAAPAADSGRRGKMGVVSAAVLVPSASHIDYAEQLMKSDLVSPSRKPYVLANLALMNLYSAEEALCSLRVSHEDQQLEPPLSDILYCEIKSVLQSRRNLEGRNPAVTYILAAAIDEGSQNRG